MENTARKILLKRAFCACLCALARMFQQLCENKAENCESHQERIDLSSLKNIFGPLCTRMYNVPRAYFSGNDTESFSSICKNNCTEVN